MKKILLADDSITIQKVVELTFSEGDYQVVCVSNGTQALRKIAELRPDVVLLDVIMPEKNGYEVCEEIKRNPATSGIPVLLLTGTFEPFDKKRAEIAGAQGHLTKPFESQALIGKVEELIAATPTVVSSEEAGGMDVISGGDVYRVGPGPAGEGMRPVAPPVQAGLSAPAPPGSTPGQASLVDQPPMPPPRDPEEPVEPAWPHPAIGPPDAASGGSYVGFADLEVGVGDEGQVVPDRYDDLPHRPPAAARLRPAELPKGYPATEPGEAPGRAGNTAPGERIEGFTGGFEMPEITAPDAAPGPSAAPAGEPDWTPPPEAPPAETWQTAEEEEASGPPPFASGSEGRRSREIRLAGDAPGNGAMSLTAEAIDLVAQRVVEKLSDRVVREIAWEVIPQVAEVLVRRRIKELEAGDTG